MEIGKKRHAGAQHGLIGLWAEAMVARDAPPLADGPRCEQRVAGRGPVSPTHANGYHGIRLVRSWERR